MVDDWFQRFKYFGRITPNKTDSAEIESSNEAPQSDFSPGVTFDKYYAKYKPNIIDQAILSTFGSSHYDPMTRLARFTIAHYSSVRPLPCAPASNRGRSIKSDVRIPSIVRVGTDDMKGTGYDRGHNVSAGAITRVINPLADPAVSTGLRKLLAIVYEHQSKYKDAEEAAQNTRDAIDAQRAKLRAEQKVRELVVTKTCAINIAVAFASALAIGHIRSHQIRVHVVGITSAILATTTFLSTRLLSTFCTAPVPKRNVVKERLLAHQLALQQTYLLPNTTAQYGEHFNNAIVAHLENLIRGINDPEAGGGHLLEWTIPYFEPEAKLPLRSSEPFVKARYQVNVEVIRCSDGGFVWIPNAYFKVVLAFDQAWSRTFTPQELIAFGAAQPVDPQATFDPMIETRDIPTHPVLTGWEVFSIPNGPVVDRTVQLADITHYDLADVTRRTGIVFPAVDVSKVERLSTNRISLGAIIPNVPQQAIDKRQGRRRRSFDAGISRSAENAPW